jgi:chromosome segregation ATPase
VEELEFLEQSKEIIDQIKSLSSDSEKINNIVAYLIRTNTLLSEYATVINGLLVNQKRASEAFNINLNSISNLHDRIVDIEKHLEIHDTHIEAHDKHLDVTWTQLDNHDKYLSFHDAQLETLSQRIDLLE